MNAELESISRTLILILLTKFDYWFDKLHFVKSLATLIKLTRQHKIQSSTLTFPLLKQFIKSEKWESYKRHESRIVFYLWSKICFRF